MKTLGKTAATLAAALLLAGCGAAAQPEAPSAQEAAAAALETLYSCDADESAAFAAALNDSAADESALTDYARRRLGGAATDAGCETALDNRVVDRVTGQWPDTAVEAGEVALTEAYTQTDTQAFYRYEVTATPAGGEAGTFTGEISLVLEDGAWLVDSVQ